MAPAPLPAGWKLTSSTRSCPDVGHVQIAGQPVEGEAPGIPQSVGPYLVAEGVAGGNRVGGDAGKDIDPKNLAEQGSAVLPVAQGVAAAAAVTAADVKMAVGSEGKLPAVVIGKGLDDVQQLLAGEGIGAVGIGAQAETGDDGIADTGPVGVVDVEGAARGESGRKGKPQEPLFAAGRGDEARDVEKGSGEDGAVADDSDTPFLLDHEEPAASIPGVGDGDRLCETAGNARQGNDGGKRGRCFGRIVATAPTAAGGEGKGDGEYRRLLIDRSNGIRGSSRA